MAKRYKWVQSTHWIQVVAEMPYSKRGPVYIYEILDHERVRYVGASKNPYARVLQHLSGAGKWKRSRVHRWLRAAAKSGKPWSIRIIKRFPDRYKAEEYERIRSAVAAAFGTILNVQYPDSSRGIWILKQNHINRKLRNRSAG